MAVVTPDLPELFEEAYERAGLEMRSGYDLKTARRSLNLLTLEWQNRGLNLFTIEAGTLPITAGTETPYTLAYYRLKGIDGLSNGIGGDVSSVPPRFVPALVSGMAYYIAMKKPDVAARVPLLKQEYEFQFQLAAGEDEETASIKFVPFDTFMLGG